MIDLHTHTTASDGRLSPAELVTCAAAAGVTVLGVTDHDTLAACDAVRRVCAELGIAWVPGIEVTAVENGRDVHVLGYFVEPDSASLHSFLVTQRMQRAQRIRAIVDLLAAQGVRLDAEAILQPTVDDPSRAPGRPWIARALVAAGHSASIGEAFERWIGTGRPAFVPRIGARPGEVVRQIHDAGGVASLAHPVLCGPDGEADKAAWIEQLVCEGLDAIEAYHSKHDAGATARYLSLAARLGIEVSGGSDFHGDPQHGPMAPGAVALPADRFERLKSRSQTRQN